MSTKLAITEQRMLQLMEWALKNDLVEKESDYWEKIGFLRTNITNVRKGIQGFTKEHIRNACLFTGANANWILDLEKNMFREREGKPALQLLKEATAAIEAELSGKKKAKQLS